MLPLFSAGGIGLKIVARRRLDQSAEDAPPLSRQARSAELGQVREELVPGQDSQAACPLHERDERAPVA